MSGGRRALGLVCLVTACAALPAPALGHDAARSGSEAANMANLFLLRDPVPVSSDPAVSGAFSNPFTEPTIDGQPTSAVCVTGADGRQHCKPAGSAVSVLPSGRILYWNNLEGTDSIKFSIVTDYGVVSANDQSRLLTLAPGGPHWAVPSPEDGGANPSGMDTHPLIDALSTHETYNDGALFCSSNLFLADGRVLAAGGSGYYNDPGLDGFDYGVVEFEGLVNSRVFDPATNTWNQVGGMHTGRWYPTMIELGDGKVMVASGVRKLAKPIYPDRPPTESGSNVRQTETFDPATGKWTDNGTTANRSLPLFPRLHLLPDGHVFYNPGGQVFSPLGYSYDEATWNIASSYNPATRTWKGLGVPGIGTGAPGFRGSTFSIMLPLKPDPLGNYTKASFLAAGGVLLPTPGSYFSTVASNINTVDTTGGADTLTTRKTGPLHRGRWYSTGVLLPTGEVVAFSGADRDEVVSPGLEIPERQAELFNPQTETWRPIAVAHQPRTYHNTAALLPDGRVLIGGHAPIPFLYSRHIDIPGPFAPNKRDPSFEVFSPPYLFRGARPTIEGAPQFWHYGSTIPIALDIPGADVRSVVLMHNTSITHLVDANQRSVELPVVAANGNTVFVKAPPDGNVAPPGPYTLFVNKQGNGGLVPSKGRSVFVEP
jgi:Galactose oxidase-like, Early set domain